MIPIHHLIYRIYNKGDASMIHHWLTSSLHESFSPEIAQSIKSAAKVKRQQQAIIETRQRKMAFPIPNKKQKLVKGMLTIALDKKKSNMSIDSDNENNATTFPPSPPALANQYMPFPVKSNKKRSMASPQHDAKRTRIMPKDAPHDNLLLLATQATQMRDLPLSPAISPQSTVHPEQTQRLPSLKTMILELSHHTDQNMDSRA